MMNTKLEQPLDKRSNAIRTVAGKICGAFEAAESATASKWSPKRRALIGPVT